MRRFLGVDAGGTRTRLVVIDEHGRVLARGIGGPGNLRRGGARGLAHALRAARADAGIDGPADAAFLGVAGAATEEERDVVVELGEALGLAPHGRVGADHDLRVAHAGAFGAGSGVVVIAGTGSAAYGRDAQGRSLRSGVWDHAPDDPGSGYDLGRHAIEAFRAAPLGARPQALEALLRSRLAPDAWSRLCDGQPLARGEVAALAPAVLEAVARGDRDAVGALLTGLRELCGCVRYVQVELGCRLPVAVVGGMTASAVWSTHFAETLARIVPEAVLESALEEPVIGAARLAAGI